MIVLHPVLLYKLEIGIANKPDWKQIKNQVQFCYQYDTIIAVNFAVSLPQYNIW